jgi:hypothetical protein
MDNSALFGKVADQQASETYAIVTVRFKGGHDDATIVQYMTWSRYLDKWSRRKGEWAIDARLVVIDFDETREIKSSVKKSRASRDRLDPSYAVPHSRPANKHAGRDGSDFS